MSYYTPILYRYPGESVEQHAFRALCHQRVSEVLTNYRYGAFSTQPGYPLKGKYGFDKVTYGANTLTVPKLKSDVVKPKCTPVFTRQTNVQYRPEDTFTVPILMALPGQTMQSRLKYGAIPHITLTVEVTADEPGLANTRAPIPWSPPVIPGVAIPPLDRYQQITLWGQIWQPNLAYDRWIRRTTVYKVPAYVPAANGKIWSPADLPELAAVKVPISATTRSYFDLPLPTLWCGKPRPKIIPEFIPARAINMPGSDEITESASESPSSGSSVSCRTPLASWCQWSSKPKDIPIFVPRALKSASDREDTTKQEDKPVSWCNWSKRPAVLPDFIPRCLRYITESTSTVDSTTNADDSTVARPHATWLGKPKPATVPVFTPKRSSFWSDLATETPECEVTGPGTLLQNWLYQIAVLA